MYIQRLVCNLDFDDFYILSKQYTAFANEPILSHFFDQMLEIVYCHNGQQVFEVNKKVYKIKGGEILITFPGEPHSSNQMPEEKGVFYWLQVYIPLDNSVFLKLLDNESRFLIQELLSLKPRTFKVNPNFKKLLDQMLDSKDAINNEVSKILNRTLLLQSLFLLIESAHQNVTSKDENRATTVKSFINKNLSSNLSVSSVAKIVYLSNSHFKAWFKTEFGINFSEYVQRKRIEDSILHWKKNPHKTIQQIAGRLNFSSPQYFASIFKKIIGKTPSNYFKKI